MTAVINWQPSAILVLDALVNIDGQRIPQNHMAQDVETVFDDTQKAFYIKQHNSFTSDFFFTNMHVY